jgi:IclR family KDG regulon transcriptional repressor
MLAFAPQHVIDDVIATHLDQFIHAAIRTRAAVLQLLEKIRNDGFYLSVGESNPEVLTISAPVRDASGQVVAALSLIGRAGELGKKSTPGHIKCVRDGAEKISKRLG